MKTILKKIKNKFYIDNDIGQKEINKQLVIIFVSIMVTVVSTIGVTLAAFVWSDTSLKEQKLIVGNLELSIDKTEDSPEKLGDDLEYPISDSDSKDLTPYTFTVTNRGDFDTEYEISIADDVAAITEDGCDDIQLDKSQIKFRIEGAKYLTDTLNNYDNQKFDEGLLTPGESRTYKIYLWIKSDAPNSVIGKHFHGKISLITKQTTDRVGSLADSIIGDNNIQTQDPVFTEGTNDVGLYKLNGSTSLASETGNGDIYYFRGPVTNNYVEFGTYKTDIVDHNTNLKKGEAILWRIVRINGDGSIELITENSVDNTSWYSQDASSTEGYKGSLLEEKVDTWFNSTFTEQNLNKLVQMTDFCNKKKATNTNNPSLSCDDQYKIQKKAGILSLDEIIFAGTYPSIEPVKDQTTYLNTGYYFHTMTGGYGSDSSYFFAHDYGFITMSTYDSCEVRPVITLSPDAVIKSGTGTRQDPYLIRIDEE